MPNQTSYASGIFGSPSTYDLSNEFNCVVGTHAAFDLDLGRTAARARKDWTRQLLTLF